MNSRANRGLNAVTSSNKAEGMPLTQAVTKPNRPKKITAPEGRPRTPVGNRQATEQISSSVTRSQRNLSAKSAKGVRNASPIESSKQIKSPISSKKTRGKENIMTPKTKNFDSIQSIHEDSSKRSINNDTYQDQECDRLLDSLKEGCKTQFDPAALTSHFLTIINNPSKKSSKSFMPKDKCRQDADGRQCLRIGQTDIYYDDDVIDTIINFSMRSKMTAGATIN